MSKINNFQRKVNNYVEDRIEETFKKKGNKISERLAPPRHTLLRLSIRNPQTKAKAWIGLA